MISLNTDEKRNLQFEVTIQGIDYKELQGALTFEVEDIRYGFPVKILADHIAVEVPPLDDVIKKGMKDGDIIECKLDIFGNGFYLNPWTGNFKIKTPVKMEAKMRYEDDIIHEAPKPKTPVKKKITATLKEEPIIPEVEDEIIYEEDPRKSKLSYDEIDRDVLLKELFEKVTNKLSERIESQTPNKKSQLIKESKNKSNKMQSLVESKLSKMNNIVDQYLSVKQKLKKESVAKSKPKRNTSNLLEDYGYNNPRFKKSIQQKQIKSKPKETQSDDPISLMESFGMKNPRIQKLMIEKAKDMGGNDNVFETLKRMLSNDRQKTPFEDYMSKKS